MPIAHRICDAPLTCAIDRAYTNGTIRKYTWSGRIQLSGIEHLRGVSNFTNATDECFAVKDTSSISTTQSWLPQDSATVTLGSGGTPSGTVVFSLYNNGTCSGTAAATFSDGSAPYETNNSTYRTASTIISWSATFTPTDPSAVGGSVTTRCERSDLTIDNSASVFPPAP